MVEALTLLWFVEIKKNSVSLQAVEFHTFKYLTQRSLFMQISMFKMISSNFEKRPPLLFILLIHLFTVVSCSFAPRAW